MKTRRHMRHFSPTARSWPHDSAPSCKAPQSLALFAVKMRRFHRIAARSPNCGAFGKNHGTFGKKRRNSVFGTSRTNPKANHNSAVRVLIKKWRANFTNCCVLFDIHSTYPHQAASACKVTAYSDYWTPFINHPNLHTFDDQSRHATLYLPLCFCEHTTIRNRISKF